MGLLPFHGQPFLAAACSGTLIPSIRSCHPRMLVNFDRYSRWQTMMRIGLFERQAFVPPRIELRLCAKDIRISGWGFCSEESCGA